MGIKQITQSIIRPGPKTATASVTIIDGSKGSIYTNTSAYWATQISYVPKNGDIIVYSDRETIVEDGVTKFVPGFKIGDGNAFVVDLPFTDAAVVERFLAHVEDHNAHVTIQEKEFWNNKLNLSLNGETLEFNRH